MAAKQSKQPVSKGFFFYVFLLISIVVTVITVLGLVMVIFKVSLFGMEFVYYNKSTVYRELNTGDLDAENNPVKDEVDFNDITEINIEVNSAEVYFVSNGDLVSSIKVEENSFGFASSDGGTKYDTDIKLKNGVVTFKYKSPVGPILMDNTKIYFIARAGSEPDSFKNIKVNFKSESGTLNIGGASGVGKNPVGIKDLTASSVSGSIIFDKFSVDPTFKFGNLSFKTESSNVTLIKKVSAESITFESNSGKFISTVSDWKDVSLANLEYDLSASSGLKIKVNTSTLNLGNVKGNIDFFGNTANVNINVVNGNFASDETGKNSNFKIGRALGEFAINNGESANIEIGETYGAVGINVLGGSVKIGKIMGSVVEISTSSGDIEVFVEESVTGRVLIQTETGRVKASFNKFNGENIIRSNKASVEVKFYVKLSFNLNIENFDLNKTVFSWGAPTGDVNEEGTYHEAPNGGGEGNLTLAGEAISLIRHQTKI